MLFLYKCLEVFHLERRAEVLEILSMAASFLLVYLFPLASDWSVICFPQCPCVCEMGQTCHFNAERMF